MKKSPVSKSSSQPTQILNNESGQGLTEYLVLLILISVASITIVTQMGTTVENRFRAAKEKINSLSVNGN